MMIRTVLQVAFLAAALVGCSGEESDSVPQPFALNDEAMGRYCGMNVTEHPGPKGQVILDQIPEPIWFSSARDTIAFTLLPEEPKDIGAIYVSDMGKAESWESPGATNWVDARKAFYVIGSSTRSGMGTPEAVPFSERKDAEKFAADRGGQVMAYADIPPTYVLGDGEDEAAAPLPGEEHTKEAHQ